MPTFGERLRYLRKINKVTIKKVSETLGVSTRMISFYETNEREPNFESLLKLSELFRCSTDYLLGKTDVILDKDIIENMSKIELMDLLLSMHDKITYKDKDITKEEFDKMFQMIPILIDRQLKLESESET